MTKETGQPQMPKITRNPTQWSADWGRFQRMKNDAAYLAANHKRLQADYHAMGDYEYRLENENRVLKAEIKRLKVEIERLFLILDENMVQYSTIWGPSQVPVNGRKDK